MRAALATAPNGGEAEGERADDQAPVLVDAASAGAKEAQARWGAALTPRSTSVVASTTGTIAPGGVMVTRYLLLLVVLCFGCDHETPADPTRRPPAIAPPPMVTPLPSPTVTPLPSPTETPLPVVTPAPQEAPQLTPEQAKAAADEKRTQAKAAKLAAAEERAQEKAAERAAADEKRAQAKAAKRAKYETEGHYTDGDRVTVAMNLSAGLKDTGGGFQATGTTLLFVNLTGDGTGRSDCTKQALRELLTLATGEFLVGLRRAGFEQLGCYPNGPYIDVP